MKKKIYSCEDNFDPNAITVESAIKNIAKNVPKKNIETILLKDSHGHILAENIRSNINVPNSNNSAMDGYAMKFSSLNKNTVFKVVGKSYAGKPFNRKIGKKECIKIMTGAVVPSSCDIVIMKENITVTENNEIKVHDKKIKKYKNIRFAGEDIKKGKILIKKGVEIDSAIMGVISSIGLKKVKIFRKPIVSFFTTGDEIISKGKIKKGQVFDSNRFSLIGLLDKHHIEYIDLGHSNDNKESIRRKFKRGIKNSDIIVSCGGVSVGDADYIKDVANEIGKINFWKVAMKPGRPLTFGKINKKIFFGLPGNPVSVMVTFLIFVLPAIYKYSNKNYHFNLSEAKLENNIRKNKGRTEFQRGFYSKIGKNFKVKSTGEQGSGILTSMMNANCFIYLPSEKGNVKKGSNVKILLFDNLL